MRRGQLPEQFGQMLASGLESSAILVGSDRLTQAWQSEDHVHGTESLSLSDRQPSGWIGCSPRIRWRSCHSATARRRLVQPGREAIRLMQGPPFPKGMNRSGLARAASGDARATAAMRCWCGCWPRVAPTMPQRRAAGPSPDSARSWPGSSAGARRRRSG